MIEIKEIDQSGAVIDEKWEQMWADLQQTRKAIRLALQQLINMRKEQVAYKILLDKELGVRVDAEGLLPQHPGWKDRSCEKTYLKSELVSLVHHLQTLDKKFRFDPTCFPSSLSTSREVLLTDKQMEDLVVLYQEYNVYRSENERKAAEAFREYLKMRQEYETKLLHNNAMVDEINDIRKRIKELKTQAIEDKCFMKFLVTFKLYKEKPSIANASRSKSTPTYAIDACPSDSQLQKYQSMWKSNLEEREYFHQFLEHLEEGVEEARQRIVRAERLCMDNASLVKDLEKRVQEEAFFTLDKRAGTDDSFKRIYWGVSGQLMAVLNENKYIRRFLQRNVLPKEKDFLQLRSSLEAKADEYRKEIVEATPKPPEQVIEEKPEPKPKLKKKGKK